MADAATGAAKAKTATAEIAATWIIEFNFMVYLPAPHSPEASHWLPLSVDEI
jgi:hypothetical protein